MADPLRSLRKRAAAATDAVARVGLSRPIESPQRSIRALLGLEPEPRFDGQTIVVTGSSSGIGEAAARRFAAGGAKVILVARRKEELERIAKEIKADGGTAEARVCDLADADAARALGESIVADHGPVAVLVNNAGRSIRRPIRESFDRFHDFERTMAVNYFGPVALSLAVLPSMLEAGKGRIVNVSTWGTRVPSPQFAAYTASKSALDSFGRSVSAELSGSGVSVASVHIPLTRTPMIAPAQKEYRGMPSISADDAAGLLIRAAKGTASRVEPAFVTAVAVTDSIAGHALERAMGRPGGMFSPND